MLPKLAFASVTTAVLAYAIAPMAQRLLFMLPASSSTRTTKEAITAADLLNDQVVPLYEAHDIRLQRVLTDRGTEYCGKKEEHAMNLLESIEDDGGVVYEKRSRLLFERQPTNKHNNLKRTLCLNETLCAERDVSSASRYKVKRDGKDIGLFKSSGLIISTGTGSTGWLYSVRQITPD